MKKTYLIIILVFWFIPVVYAHNINQQQLTDSLRAYAARYTVLDARIRIKHIRQSNGHISIETNPSLSCLPYTPQRVREIKNLVRRVANLKSSTRIDIYTDGYEIEQLIGNHYLPKQQRRRAYTIVDNEKPLVHNLTLPYSAPQGLDNKYIALWASHGRFYDQKQQRWRWQRANLLETVEDLLTSSFTMPFLVPMLENAGAIVIQPRERDTQINEVVMESNEAVGDDRQAWFFPRIPQDGNYAVYAWWEQSPNASDTVTYTILHDEYETPIQVNQHMGGHTWIYLGNYFFRAGQNENTGVKITGLGKNSKQRLKQCRMKFGGGMGSIARSADTTDIAEMTVSGLPRWMEGSRYWLEYAGIPDSVIMLTEGKNDYTDDFSCRGRWLNYICGGSPAHPDSAGLRIPVNLGLAFHTDAGTYLGDTTVGTLTIYTDRNNDKIQYLPTGNSRLTIRDYAERVQTQVVEDIRRVYAPEWNRRELRNASYSETRNPEVPTIILELLSHQNIADMKYGHDPRFKFLVSRAVYKGILKYISDQYNYDYVVQPLPVNNFALKRIGNDSIRLSWQPTTDTLEATATPQYYIVYEQHNEGSWSHGIKTTKTSITLPIKPHLLTAYQVAAGNNGGISLPSETLAAYINPKEKGNVLIINGFTRVSAPQYINYDENVDGFNPESYGIAYGKEISFSGKQYEFNRELKWKSDDDPGYGASYQDYIGTLEAGNTFDYPVVHGKAIARMGYSFVSQSAGYLNNHDIDTSYAFIDIILGKQKQSSLGIDKKTIDYKTFTPALQHAIKKYSASGGNIIVSGSYIASDMQSAADKDFTKNILHYSLQSADASRNGHLSTTKLPMTYMQLLTKPNEIRIPAESPDALEPEGNDAKTFLTYTDTKKSAAIFYDGNNKVAALGFPIESISTYRQILLTMKMIVDFFEYKPKEPEPQTIPVNNDINNNKTNTDVQKEEPAGV